MGTKKEQTRKLEPVFLLFVVVLGIVRLVLYVKLQVGARGLCKEVENPLLFSMPSVALQ